MEEETYPLTELDRIANGRELLMLKAILPYFPAGSSSSMAFLIKIAELQNIRTYYQNRKPSDLSAMSAAAPSVPELLQNLLRFSPPDLRESLRQFQNIMETIQMFENMQDMFGGEFSYGEPEYTEQPDEQPAAEYAAWPEGADEQPGSEFTDESDAEPVILDE